MKNILKIATTAILAVLSLCACSSNDDEKNGKLLTFHVANDRSISEGLARYDVAMPFSGFVVRMNRDQFMYTGDIARVDLAEIRLVDGPMTGFLFTCNERGKKRLLQATAANMGGYIVVLYGGEPIGLRKIDTTMADGSLFVNIELPKDADVNKFYEELAKSIVKVDKIKKDSENSW